MVSGFSRAEHEREACPPPSLLSRCWIVARPLPSSHSLDHSRGPGVCGGKYLSIRGCTCLLHLYSLILSYFAHRGIIFQGKAQESGCISAMKRGASDSGAGTSPGHPAKLFKGSSDQGKGSEVGLACRIVGSFYTQSLIVGWIHSFCTVYK